MAGRRRIAILACGLLLAATAAAPGRAGEEPAAPRTIEAGGQRFLEHNPAPAEIAEDWLAWVDRTGTSVWDRPQLTRGQRSLVTIAMLSVLREEGPLRVHVEAGLANGLTRSEIAETIMHTAVYAGVPQALRSMRVAREVFDELDARAASTAPGSGTD